MDKIRIDGIVRIANRVRQKLQFGIQPQEIEQFQTYVVRSIQDIESLCAKRNAKPSQLPAEFRQAYLTTIAVQG